MHSKENKDYVLEVICDSVTILLPLSCISKILSKDDKELLHKNNGQVVYNNREYQVYNLSELLKRKNSGQNYYAILIQNEDIEAILYVENVGKLIATDDLCYELPIYLEKFDLGYIISCSIIGNNEVGFKIDFTKLLKRYYK